MKLTKWGAAALALSVLSITAAHAQTPQNQGVTKAGGFANELQEAELAQYSTAPGGMGLGALGMGGGSAASAAMAGVMSRPIQIVAGAQYVYARANVSQGLAYVRQDLINAVDEFVQYDFNYKSSYGFFGGINFADCGGAILFDFTRLRSDASVAETEVAGQTAIFGPYEIDDDVQAFADVDLKSYNLSFAKTIPLGCPLLGGGCDCGDACATGSCSDCASGCGCGVGCPAWDITWTGGVRWAEVGWTHGLRNFDVLDPNLLNRSATTTMDFSGFGGRIGIGGRRYFGSQGLVSLYAKGDLSVLIGEIDVANTVFSRVAQATTVARTSCRHIVPVTEVELGGAVHLGAHATLSAGYFFAAWHDLGFRDEYDFQQFQTSHYDDANILGFDGFFARAEIAF